MTAVVSAQFVAVCTQPARLASVPCARLLPGAIGKLAVAPHPWRQPTPMGWPRAARASACPASDVRSSAISCLVPKVFVGAARALRHQLLSQSVQQINPASLRLHPGHSFLTV